MRLEKITTVSEEKSVTGLAFEMLVGLWFKGQSSTYKDNRNWDDELIDKKYQKPNAEELRFVSSRQLTDTLLDRLMLKARLYESQEATHESEKYIPFGNTDIEHARTKIVASVDRKLLRELYTLFLDSDMAKWKPNSVIACPWFGEGEVHAHVGDFLVNHTLLDIKVSKVRKPKSAFEQLADYFLCNWELDDPLIITKLAVYWARQGIIQELAIPQRFIDYFMEFHDQLMVSSQKVPEFINYVFENYSDRARLRQQGRLERC